MRKAALEGRASEPNIAQVFQQSRDNGLKHIPEIAQAWSPKLSLFPKLIADYLTENVDYGLDAENMEGLRLFYKYGLEYGVFSQVPDLAFIEQTFPEQAFPKQSRLATRS